MATATKNSRSTRPAPEAQAAPAPAAQKENPRTVRSREKFEEAKALIAKRLAKGEWVSSETIHREFQGKIAEGMYGRVKSALGIEHRRVRNGNKAQYEWRMEKQPAKR